MKKAYLYFLMGTVLMFFSLRIVQLDLIIHLCSYFLIIYALSLINERHQDYTLTFASQLMIGLFLFEILQAGNTPLQTSSSLLTTVLNLLILVNQLLVFYLIIKSESDETESFNILKYKQMDIFISLSLLSLYLFSYFSFFASSLFNILHLYFFFFLIYVFYKFYHWHHHSS